MTNAPKCPLCKKPMDTKFRPFCSKGCKMVDLNRWLSDSYRIPGERAPSADNSADEE